MKTPRKDIIRNASALLALTALAAVPAHAALLATDDFEDYTAASNIHGQTGGTGWSGGWAVLNTGSGAVNPTPGAAMVSSTSITYVHDGVTLGGGQSLLLGSTSNGTQRDVFSSVNTGGSDFYASMIFQVSGGVFAGWQAKDASVDINNDSIGLVNTDGSVRARVDNTTVSSAAGLVAAATTYFLVIEYTGWTGTNYTTVNVWLNPNTGDQSNSTISATYTDTTPGDGGGSAGFGGLYARIVPNSGQSMLIDDLRVGTDWASVTSIPEPSAASLAAGGVVALCALFNRRRRS